MHFRSILIAGFLGVVFLICSFPAQARIETMTVSELSPGMQGIGRTVISGTEIEEFQCEIIDVFTSMGFNGGPFILVRVWGDVIDRTGGIAGGYSGSPIFIDGKLIGALSSAWYFTEGDVGGVTPINDMLRAFTYPDEDPPRIGNEPVSFDDPVTLSGRTFERILLADYNEDGAALENLHGENTLVMTPCKTPLIVSGLSSESFERLAEFANDRLPYMELVQGPGGSSGDGIPMRLDPTYLEPGASIGAQLASGDLDLTAVGTLTWVDDDGRFLAYGHPFLMDGPTGLPFVTSKIIYTMPSINRSFKLGEPIEMVGSVTQDRSVCIAGQFGAVPDMVDFHLEVIDHDIGRTRRFNYSVINKEEWLPLLGLIVPMEGLTYAADRTGGGTCKINFTVNGEGFGKPIEWENLSYASYGASESLTELYEVLNMLTTGNPYREVKVTDVNIEIEMTSVRQTLNILKARYQNPPNVGPGAIGYTGPDPRAEKEAKDRMATEQARLMHEQGGIEDQSINTEDMMTMADMLYADTTMPAMPTGLVGYHPGDTVELLVTLRPWREEPIEQIVEFEIPEDFPLGQTSIEIMGGTSSGWYGMDYYYMYYGGGYGDSEDDLDTTIESFLARDSDNSIVVRMTRPVSEDDPYFYLQDGYESPEPVKSSMLMGDAIYGYYTLPIEIIGESDDVSTDMPAGMPTDMEGMEQYMEQIMDGTVPPPGN